MLPFLLLLLFRDVAEKEEPPMPLFMLPLAPPPLLLVPYWFDIACDTVLKSAKVDRHQSSAYQRSA